MGVTPGPAGFASALPGITVAGISNTSAATIRATRTGSLRIDPPKPFIQASHIAPAAALGVDSRSDRLRPQERAAIMTSRWVAYEVADVDGPDPFPEPEMRRVGSRAGDRLEPLSPKNSDGSGVRCTDDRSLLHAAVRCLLERSTVVG